MSYRIYLYNTKTKAVFAEIPFSALSYSYVMDEAGSATVEIPIGVPRTDGQPLTPDDLMPVRTGVVIERDGALVWGGLLWAYRLNLTARTIALSAQGYLSYWAKRMTGANGVVYKNLEQTQMVKNFITAAANSIETDVSLITPTNMVRTRTWNKYEFKPLAEVFTDLADDITSFDPVSGTYGGGFFLYFEPYWITEGQTIGNRVRNTPDRHPYDSGHNLQQGVNCEFPDISVDGTTLAGAAFAVGATDGTASVTPYKTDTNPAQLATMPQVNVVLNENGIKQATSLQYKVRSALAFGSAPVILPTASTYPGMFSPLEFAPGMSVGVTSDDGFLNLVNADYVVTENSVSVASDGSDRLSLTLVQSDLFKETEE
ncbi:minor tail protein [Streptomyces phage Shaeky]|uniref:Minor tail protein n=1 Tax=Streptomyces phage Shaeky TaxID=2767586 RepID=A0A873WL49_9CAUD|nr:minor tail protein [Streptomyces phage Shaeky]